MEHIFSSEYDAFLCIHLFIYLFLIIFSIFFVCLFMSARFYTVHLFYVWLSFWQELNTNVVNNN